MRVAVPVFTSGCHRVTAIGNLVLLRSKATNKFFYLNKKVSLAFLVKPACVIENSEEENRSSKSTATEQNVVLTITCGSLTKLID